MHLSILSRAWQTILNFMEGKCSGAVNPGNTPQIFTFSELSASTKNFNPELMVTEGHFERIYKGKLQPNNKLVAVKQFKPNEQPQRHKHFYIEVLLLRSLRHENIINLHGYCAEENHMLLVLEKAALRSLRNALSPISRTKNKSDFKPLDWSARTKIALGVAKGLEHLHNNAFKTRSVVHRDLQASSIMLGEDLTPKISNFELAKLCPMGNRKHVFTKVVGTSGYIAPEYAKHGLVSAKLDVYSFGIVLLELTTGRSVSDFICNSEGHDLASWVWAVAKDTKKLLEIADPQLKGEFLMEDLSKMFAVASMGLREESEHRPSTADVVALLSSLLVASDDKDSTLGCSKAT